MTADELSTLLGMLEDSRRLDPSSPEYLAIERAAAHLTKTAKKKRKLARKRVSSAEDAATRATAGLSRKRAGDSAAVDLAPRTLNRERSCYVCKAPFVEMHRWYPQLCPRCGERSEAMKVLPIPLTGRRALVTGGRIKIGYATALRLLRSGAEVHVTSRFPADTARRYASEPDAASWRDRLHVHGLDFRDLGRLVAALEAWRDGPPFDIVINNAAQSVWHPPEYYAALRAGEAQSNGGVATSESLVQRLLPDSLARLDANRADSWVQRLGEVAPLDMIEVHVVNAIAPFLICGLLRENLRRSEFPSRFIVNVSAIEGQFHRADKSVRHPHTNMAKAALNMLTRTSADDLRADGIFMASVDPGWMSKEGQHVDPHFEPPLEAEDCAARVVHPIASGLMGAPLSGVLLKDFVEVPW